MRHSRTYQDTKLASLRPDGNRQNSLNYQPVIASPRVVFPFESNPTEH
jgi:hypothetical protein